MTRRGAILLEILLALALFVMASMTLLSIVSQSLRGLTVSRDRLIAADHARNAMSMIEAGIAMPESLNGPVQAWDAGLGVGPGFVGVDPGDSPAPADGFDPEWSLEIETERTEFEGLTLVHVRAFRIDSGGFESAGSPSFSLHQFVRQRGGVWEGGDDPGSGGAPMGRASGGGMGLRSGPAAGQGERGAR